MTYTIGDDVISQSDSSALIPGDVNGDGFVDQADLDIVNANWGKSSATRLDGDLNGNDVVDGPDYTEVISYWGTVGPTPIYFGYDGHGSTRLLLKPDGSIQVRYAYDAYGNADGFDAKTAATKYLYAGEQYDANLGMTYLRARYYNAANGTFNRMDPYAGSPHDPQSLHKYAYARANPVMYTDPSGHFTLNELMTTVSNISTLTSILSPALAPVVGDVLYRLIPQTWKDRILVAGFSAFSVEGSAVVGGTLGPANIMIGGGLAGLVSPFTRKFAGYGAFKAVGALGGKGFTASAGVSVGMVFGANHSQNYTGNCLSFTLPFSKLSQKMRAKIWKGLYQSIGVIGAALNPPSALAELGLRINPGTITTSIATAADKYMSVTISGWHNLVVAVTIDFSISTANAPSGSSVVWSYYSQIYPDSETRVPF